ncbi:MAG: hypothetical protein ACFC1C_02760 [Candidatus Malihini olakiniferum]
MTLDDMSLVAFAIMQVVLDKATFSISPFTLHTRDKGIVVAFWEIGSIKYT